MDKRFKDYLIRTENEVIIKEPWQLKVIAGFLRELLEREEKAPDYDCPSWAYKQADKNGAKRILRELIRVLETTK